MPYPINYVPVLGHNDAFPTDFRTGLAASTTDLGGGNAAGGKVALDVNIAGQNGRAGSGDYSIFGQQVVESQNQYVAARFGSLAEANATTYDASTGGGSSNASSGNLIITGVLSGEGVRYTKSEVIYVPGQEGRASFTAVFAPPTAGCVQKIGFLDPTGVNGAYLEQNVNGLCVVHLRGGSIRRRVYATPQSDSLPLGSSWNGTISTEYVDGTGTVIPFNEQVGRPYRIRFGHLGYAGIVVDVMAPGSKQFIVLDSDDYGDQTVPIFTEPDMTFAWKSSGAVTLKSGSVNVSTIGQPKSPLISTANRTETALGAGATFTGDWISTEGYNSLELIVVTDQVSASNGLVFQFSERGDASAVVRTTSTETFSASDASTGSKKVIITPYLSFCRMIYTNGGTAQGSLFLELRLHRTPLEVRRSSIESDINATNTATMGRNLLVAKNDSSVYANLTRSPATNGVGAKSGIRSSISEAEVAVPARPLDSVSGNANAAITSASAVQVASSPPANTQQFMFHADSTNTKPILLHTDNTVSAGNAMYELPAGADISIPVVAGQAFWAIATAGTQTLRWIYGVRTV